MIIKNVTLKAHCGSCLSLLFKKPVLVKLLDIKYLSLANNILKSVFPNTITCKECNHQKVEYSYCYTHVHQYKDATEKADIIDRCKNQIAATYDTNSDIPAKERAIIREGFQEQLAVLLAQNHLTIK